MMSTYVKFCGIRTPSDLNCAVAVGVDAIGLVLAPESVRTLSLQDAAALRNAAPLSLDIFLLVRNADAEFIRTALHLINPGIIQFHGNESVEFCRQFERPYCKALSFNEPDLHGQIRAYDDAEWIILDGHAPGAAGGSGIVGDWQIFSEYLGERGMLAGGLHAGNVADALRVSRATAVDVSSGIESEPGVKSPGRMAAFMQVVRSAHQEH